MIIKCIMLLSVLMFTGQCVNLSHENNSQDLQIVSVRSHNQLPSMKSGQMSFFFYIMHCVVKSKKMLTWKVQLYACILGISVMINGFTIILQFK